MTPPLDTDAGGPDHRQPPRRKRHEVGVRAILARQSQGDPAQAVSIAQLLMGLGRRSFGMLLLISILPAFIPIPVGGAISGPLVMLIGVQLLFGRRRPWLPKWISRRSFQRDALARFSRRIDPWLARMERGIRPRALQVLDWRGAMLVTGLLLLLLGLLLSLPIPFTNYLFGSLLLLYALALLERDGALMLLAWGLGIITVVVFGVLSGELVALAAHWIERLF